MSLFSILKKGIKQFWQYRQMWLLLYLLTLIMAIFIAMPIKTYLESKAGHSLMVGDLIKGFDYTFLNDFMINYGDGFAAIQQQSMLIIGLLLLLMVFFAGGIFSVYKEKPLKYSSVFWSNSATYFWKMLRLTIYFFFVHALVLVFFLFIYYSLTNGFSVQDDTIIFTAWKWLLPFYMLVSAFFFMWHDYAKIMVIRSDKKWLFKPIISAFSFIIKHFKSTYSLYLVNLGFLLLVYVFQYIYSMNFEISSTSQIYIGFVFSQIFILARLAVRLINWSSASVLYDYKQ